MKWRQIVQASDGIEGDIGETGGEVKFAGLKVRSSQSRVLGNAGKHFGSNFIAIMKGKDNIRHTFF